MKTTLGVRFNSGESSSVSVVISANDPPSEVPDSDQNTAGMATDRVSDLGALEASSSVEQIRLEVEDQVPCGSHKIRNKLEQYSAEPLKIHSVDQGTDMSGRWLGIRHA